MKRLATSFDIRLFNFTELIEEGKTLSDSIIQSFLQGVFNQIKEALEQQPNEKKTIDEVKEDVVG